MKKRLLKPRKIHSARKKHHHIVIFCSCKGKILLKYIIVIGIIILLLLTGAYLLFDKSFSSLKDDVYKYGNNSAKKFIKESFIKDIKDPLIRKYYTAQSNVMKFRSRTQEGNSSTIKVQEMDMLGNAFDFKMNNSVWMEKNGKKEAEYIVFGDIIYAKDYSDNKWWKQTKKEKVKNNSGDILNTLPVPIREDFKYFESLTGDEPQKIAVESCPNIPQLTCYKYQVKKFKDSLKNTIFWFDDQEYLKRKELREDRSTSISVDLEYDNIDIKAPFPTKDLPAEKDINDFLYPL